jgi:hypothetical protein
VAATSAVTMSTVTTLRTDELRAEVRPRRQEEGLSFGESTGSLPHWTEPPTGEVPRLDVGGDEYGDDEELDVWVELQLRSAGVEGRRAH